jgi:hypothetical protein
MTELCIIGLDLSLTSAGVACIPSTWDGRLERVAVATVPHRHAPHDDTERAERLATVARQCLSAARELAAGRGIACWGIESLPTHQAHALVPLAELAGVVRYLLHQDGARVLTVPQASARKLLLGKLPRRDVKEVVRQTVRSMAGAGCFGPDEVDGFVVVNWLAAELGWQCLCAPASAA